MKGPAAKIPPGVRIAPDVVGGVNGEWVEGEQTAGSEVLLYLHGGGYFACSPKTHRAVTTAFALEGFRVFVPDYRLAPEHPFPAAVMDAVSVCRALTGESRLTIAGDSAGGGLALAAMVYLRDRGERLPSAAALFSPWTDLANTGESRPANDRKCAMFRAAGLPKGSGYYLGKHDPRDPLASPLYADLHGLPPLLIHAGLDETLLDDSTRLADRARAAGVEVSLTLWPAVPHVWQLLHRFIPEGRESLRMAARFLAGEEKSGARGGT